MYSLHAGAGRRDERVLLGLVRHLDDRGDALG
jgi:hypothetical protein